MAILNLRSRRSRRTAGSPRSPLSGELLHRVVCQLLCALDSHWCVEIEGQACRTFAEYRLLCVSAQPVYFVFRSGRVLFTFRASTLPARAALRELRRRVASCFSRRAALTRELAGLSRVRFSSRGFDSPVSLPCAGRPARSAMFFSRLSKIDGFEHEVVGTLLESGASQFCRRSPARTVAGTAKLPEHLLPLREISSVYADLTRPVWSCGRPLPPMVRRPGLRELEWVVQSAVARSSLRLQSSFVVPPAVTEAFGVGKVHLPAPLIVDAGGLDAFQALEARVLAAESDGVPDAFEAFEARTLAAEATVPSCDVDTVHVGMCLLPEWDTTSGLGSGPSFVADVTFGAVSLLEPACGTRRISLSFSALCTCGLSYPLTLVLNGGKVCVSFVGLLARDKDCAHSRVSPTLHLPGGPPIHMGTGGIEVGVLGQ